MPPKPSSGLRSTGKGQGASKKCKKEDKASNSSKSIPEPAPCRASSRIAQNAASVVTPAAPKHSPTKPADALQEAAVTVVPRNVPPILPVPSKAQVQPSSTGNLEPILEQEEGIEDYGSFNSSTWSWSPRKSVSHSSNPDTRSKHSHAEVFGYEDFDYEEFGDEDSSDESEEVTVVPQKRSRGRPRSVSVSTQATRGGSSLVPSCTTQVKNKIVLRIPTIAGMEREEVELPVNFARLQSLIFVVMKCADLAVKPSLQYKLSNARAKDAPMVLATEKAWDGCVADYLARVKKTPTLTVDIDVEEKYLASLRQRLAKESGSSSRVAYGKKKREELYDLDNEGDSDANRISEENQRMELLQTTHTCKQGVCGPDRACLIDSSGTHRPLSHNQLKAWAAAMVDGKANHLTPPNTPLFAVFRTPSAQPEAPRIFGRSASLPPPQGTSVDQTNLFEKMTQELFMPFLMGQAMGRSSMAYLYGVPIPAAPPQIPPSPIKPTIRYTSIREFLIQLQEEEPERTLVPCIDLFLSQDLITIKDIARLRNSDILREKPFGLSIGNATFIWDKVHEALKVLERSPQN